MIFSALAVEELLPPRPDTASGPPDFPPDWTEVERVAPRPIIPGTAIASLLSVAPPVGILVTSMFSNPLMIVVGSLLDLASRVINGFMLLATVLAYIFLTVFRLVQQLRLRYDALLFSVFVLGGFNRFGDRTVFFRFTSALAAFSFLGLNYPMFQMLGDYL
ncbi:hypothetical protein HDU93_001897 [Gonapodya sp. JEL0774]|nr:hypothetical protein HDU93_001897 [Gonapodya sp. JEL0774]